MSAIEKKMRARHATLCECGLAGVRLDEDCQVYAALFEGAEVEREDIIRQLKKGDPLCPSYIVALIASRADEVDP